MCNGAPRTPLFHRPICDVGACWRLHGHVGRHLGRARRTSWPCAAVQRHCVDPLKPAALYDVALVQRPSPWIAAVPTLHAERADRRTGGAVVRDRPRGGVGGDVGDDRLRRGRRRSSSAGSPAGAGRKYSASASRVQRLAAGHDQPREEPASRLWSMTTTRSDVGVAPSVICDGDVVDAVDDVVVLEAVVGHGRRLREVRHPHRARQRGRVGRLLDLADPRVPAGRSTPNAAKVRSGQQEQHGHTSTATPCSPDARTAPTISPTRSGWMRNTLDCGHDDLVEREPREAVVGGPDPHPEVVGRIDERVVARRRRPVARPSSPVVPPNPAIDPAETARTVAPL